MANHLEQLVAEWLEFTGYFVRRNVKVGRLKHGGWKCELDIVAYRYKDNRLLHIEPSMDANTWAKREYRYRKKFDAGQQYIQKEIFPWLKPRVTVEQWVILWAYTTNHPKLAGGRVVPIWDFYEMVAQTVMSCGHPGGNAISEQFPLLRTIHYSLTWAWQFGDRNDLACAAHRKFRRKPSSQGDRTRFCAWAKDQFLAQKGKEADAVPDFFLHWWEQFGNCKR